MPKKYFTKQHKKSELRFISMKVYEAVFTDSPEQGVFGVSCVDRPAMQDTWITLSEAPKEIIFEAVDEEKQILLGAILIPDKKVYRNDNGHEFYLQFSSETIEKVSHSYLKRGFQRNSTENHSTLLQDVSLVETWTVKDPLRDKSSAYGKQYPVGTWVGMMKVDQDTYKKAKEGQLTGFSIDAVMPLKEINFNSQDMSSIKSTLIETLKELGLGNQIAMKQLKLADKKTKIEFEGDAPEVGKPVFLLDGDGNKQRVPEGTLELEDGSKLEIDKDGLVAEPKAEVEEEKKEEAIEMAEVEKRFEKFAVALSATIGKEFDKIRDDNKKELALRDAQIEELKKELAAPANEGLLIQAEEIAEPKTSKERLMNVALQAVKNQLN